MQANLENLGQLERRLSVALPAEQIDAEVENRLKRLARTVKVHGFRPGKVPLKVVAQQYGSNVREEVMGDALQRSFSDAVRQQNLRVAGYPRFEVKPAAPGGGQFEFSAIFEVYPEVKIADLSKVAVERPSVQVGEAEVDKTIDILRKQHASYDPVQRGAAVDDRISIDYRGTLDGVEFKGGQATGYQMVLGEGRMIEGFEEQVTGMKAGETKKFDLTFPEDYHGRELAGKTATFEVTLNEVAEPRLPEADAAFAKSLGIEDGDVAKMRAEIKANLEREVKKRIQVKVREQVMQALLDNVQLELPKALLEAEIESLMQQARADLQGRGVNIADIPLDPAIFDEKARKRVALGLILAELVRTHSLTAKPEQVRAMVDEHAQSYEHPQEVLNWYYGSAERLREVESLALEDNVVQWVLEQTKVEDKPTAFDELMGNN
jgi:trigger factor